MLFRSDSFKTELVRIRNVTGRYKTASAYVWVQGGAFAELLRQRVPRLAPQRIYGRNLYCGWKTSAQVWVVGGAFAELLRQRVPRLAPQRIYGRNLYCGRKFSAQVWVSGGAFAELE